MIQTVPSTEGGMGGDLFKETAIDSFKKSTVREETAESLPKVPYQEVIAYRKENKGMTGYNI